MSNIMSYFPKGKKPRDVQVETLLKIEESWQKSDVIVANLSVGSGKSLVAYTVARWSSSTFKEKSPILVPNKLLNNQYSESMPIHTLMSKDSYTCTASLEHSKISCGDMYSAEGSHCADCPYVKAKKKAYVMPFGVYNFYVHMAHKFRANNLIIDEAHTLLPFVREMESRKLWKHLTHYPEWADSYGKLLKWLEGRDKWPRNDALEELEGYLRGGGKPKYVVQKGEDLYRGELRSCLKILPVDTSNSKSLLFNKANKILLLSSTIGKKDVHQLGLSGRRITYIEAANPIEAERRPINYVPVGNMSYRHQKESIPKLVEFLNEEVPKRPGKGLIHMPYSLVEKVRPFLTDSRYLFHGRTDKLDVFAKFKSATNESQPVLVASGMEEGIDLPYEDSRWQMITKVPWPSLAEPAIAYQAEDDREWYVWETVKKLVQASGRVCRALDDYGETMILDSSFERMYEQDGSLFPKWWRDALCMWEEVK